MKIRVVACDMPHPQGSAAGRHLWAWCDAAISLGHDLRAWIWNVSPVSPPGPVPEWAEYRPAGRHTRGGTFVTREDALAAGFDPEPDAVVVADNVPSGGAALGSDRSALILHFRAPLDAVSVRRLRPWHLRTTYEEIHYARGVGVVLAFSERVARAAGRRPYVVPMTAPLPGTPLPIVEEPVAALLADWWWKPNQVALKRLLRAWPEVRSQVPGARLVLGGRNFPEGAVGAMAGVEVIGPVPDSSEVLSGAAVLAFPCPTSSGPKAKTLEALALGLPVLTSGGGMEGIRLLPGGEAMVARRRDFAQRLAAMLRDPEERARLGTLGRASIVANHAPEVAATANVTAIQEGLSL